MLSIKITPNALGAIITGEPDVLLDLREAIFDVLPECDNLGVMFAKGLMYDLRKAADGRRETRFIRLPVVEHSRVYVDREVHSVKVLLPVLIAQLHIINNYIDDHLYKKIESPQLIEDTTTLLIDALEEVSQDCAQALVDWLNETPPFSDDYNYDCLEAVTAVYITAGDTRISEFEEVLESLSEESAIYRSTLNIITNHAKLNECHPDELSFPSVDASFGLLDDESYKW